MERFERLGGYIRFFLKGVWVVGIFEVNNWEKEFIRKEIGIFFFY